jgi:F-type H+-transporting ATPase subunit a
LVFTFLFILIFAALFFYNYQLKLYGTTNKIFIAGLFYNLLKNIFKENVNIKQPFVFNYIFFIFFIIFLSNNWGLIPFSYTVTSSIIVAFFLSFSSFIIILINGFKLHRTKFFVSFLPPGSPAPILPFLIIIEFISFNARAFSLAIRLFANMMSGHILLKIISVTCFSLVLMFPQSALIIIFPFFFLLIITGLEFAIAFLQAYVFVTLLCIYFNETFNLH